MSGTIAAIGDQVEGWSVGDPVTVMPLIWDGTCPACKAGDVHVCHSLALFGIDRPGSLQERWNVPAPTLVSLPKDMPLSHAALVEPTAVAVHDVRRGDVQRGDKVVVIGGGPIGVLIAFVAREMGAEPMVIEIDEQRLATVSGFGFRTLNPSATDQERASTSGLVGRGPMSCLRFRVPRLPCCLRHRWRRSAVDSLWLRYIQFPARLTFKGCFCAS